MTTSSFPEDFRIGQALHFPEPVRVAGLACRADAFPLCRDGGEERRKSGAKTRRAMHEMATDVTSDRPFEINRTAILVRDCERVFQIQCTIR
ncbi:hypothetical protein DF3PA_70037 [Candidatus Defluviicoccus seviourii]|uniref:Uncharacterized protein n=1 Tax=Candidatus Defluviicoccus seviourii TaxID=2565273 RepID=A0A564WH10_9PROT|nr:hypothetical protein DF3PA_70037 [Candidatus Defluviicoccus seviourii]